MRSLARWGSLPILAMPLGSWALSLGEIETLSYLNQPLNAEIALSATPDELASLRVSLASADDFLNEGIDYPAFLTSVRFQVTQNADGERVIRVTSGEAVAEPFVTMIVEASHARGTLSREYTMLLDPPLFLPDDVQSEPIAAPVTRQPAPEVSGGAIQRPAPAPQPRPVPQPLPEPVSRSEALPVEAGGDYTVQAGDTLWWIASDVRPAGVTINQAMISIFEANPAAFNGNINRLRRGAILRIPPSATLGSVQAAQATAEVQRQIDAWRNEVEATPQLVLLPASEDVVSGNAGVTANNAAAAADVRALEDRVTSLEGDLSAAEAELAEANRLLDIRNQELADLQRQLDESASGDTVVDTGTDTELAEEPLFVDDASDDVADDVAADQAAEPEATEAAAPAAANNAPTAAAEEPSLVGQILAWVTSPIVAISGGVLVVLLAALAFLRRKRDNEDDVTGQWQALEAELEEEADNASTARMRAQSTDSDMVVVEGLDDDETTDEPNIAHTAEMPALDPDSDAFAGMADIDALTEPDDFPQADQTLSSQTVINLDQADPIAEADFHMAYGLYDQAADLITNALDADPDNRELRLKLLEVYFVWGNKDLFLEQAKNLRADIGEGANADWDKVVIMGKQICPDEPLFSEAMSAAGEVDLDLASDGSDGLDFAFGSDDDDVDLDFGIVDESAMTLADIGEERAPGSESQSDGDMLDIGAQTRAGLEAALLDVTDDDDREIGDTETQSGATFSDLDLDLDTDTDTDTESPTETPTIETPIVDAGEPKVPTVETPTIMTPAVTGEGPGDTADEAPASSSTAEMTAELEIDDLGLDIGDLPGDISDLPDPKVRGLSLSDTSEPFRSEADDELLSATGVTQVLDDDATDLTHSTTSVLDDDDATMMAPGSDDDSVGVSTEVLEQATSGYDPEPPATEDDLDINLEDFSSALEGGDTVEQPMASRFSSDVDLDVGDDVTYGDEPSSTEQMDSFDPQTMTEVGTKLDLARAYIDMGDPEGAKSILEEVMSEGDAGQKNEARALMDALPAA